MTMLTIVLFATLLACVHPWTFQTSHANIIPKLTTDVILKCFYDGKNNGKDVTTEISRISLRKKNHKGDWKEFASKTLSGRVHTSTSGSLSGHIGIPKDSFLSITWPIALRDTVGNYRCEVDGYGTDNSLVVVDELFINITSRSASVTDLLDIFVTLQKIHSDDNAALTNQLSALEKNVSNDNADLTNLLSALAKDVSNEIKDNSFEARYWPVGPFILPWPQTGCPKTIVSNWPYKYFGIELNETALSPMASPNNHLSKPLIDSNNHLHLYFCYKSQTTGGPAWPRGSYCIQGVHETCPPSFDKTTMTFTHKTNDIDAHGTNNFLLTWSGKVMSLKYCCRNDGSASTPIILPTATPFYLYRYKGTCQAVRNMKVSSESLTLTTNPNHGSAIYTPSKVHPDVKRWNYEWELCYYTPNKQN